MKKKILIVDDDPDVIDRVTQHLEDDYDVRSTTDWGELNQIFFREGVDLILMDVNLPVLRGDQLTAIFKRGTQPTRIVLFSSEDDDTLRRLTEETKADGYLSKSIRSAELLLSIQHYLRD